MKEGDQMATMMRWDPFQDLRSAQDEMTQMSPMLAHALGLHAQQGSGTATATAWAPALDISERKDAYLVTVELPGVEVDDLSDHARGRPLTCRVRKLRHGL
jgi:HSP20 family protein